MKKITKGLAALAVVGAGLTGLNTSVNTTNVEAETIKARNNTVNRTAETTTSTEANTPAKAPGSRSVSKIFQPLAMLGGPGTFLGPDFGNPPKEYGQYLQATGKQKWTKPKKRK